MKKLNFKIDEKMVKVLDLADIAILANISRYKTAENITEFRYIKDIARAVKLSDRRVIARLATLKKLEAFTVSEESVAGCTYRRNKYIFNALDSGFILVSDSIFEIGLKADEIGFLIKAKAYAVNNGLSILGNKEEIADYLNVSKGKAAKLIDSLNSKGLIKYTTGKGKEKSNLTITCEFFLDNSTFGLNKIKRFTRNQRCIRAAQEIMEKCPNSKEARALKYYFIDKKKDVKFPIAVIRQIISNRFFVQTVECESLREDLIMF